MRVAEDYETVNVAADRASEQSVFEFYRELIALRKTDDVLVYGEFEMLADDHEEIYAVCRSLDGADHDLLVVCNFSESTPTFEATPELGSEDAEVALANLPDPGSDPSSVELRPYEAIIYRV
jgi:oligo-1,6-glucosidase